MSRRLIFQTSLHLRLGSPVRTGFAMLRRKGLAIGILTCFGMLATFVRVHGVGQGNDSTVIVSAQNRPPAPGAPDKPAVLRTLSGSFSSLNPTQSCVLGGVVGVGPETERDAYRELAQSCVLGGVVGVGVGFGLAVALGFIFTKRVRALEARMQTAVQAMGRQQEAAVGRRLDEGLSRVIHLLQEIQGRLDCPTGGGRTVTDSRPAPSECIPAKVVTRTDVPPTGLASVQEEVQFLRWLQSNAASHPHIVSGPGRDGSDARTIHRIRASDIPLPWVQADTEGAVRRIGRLNAMLRSQTGKGDSPFSLVTTSQSRIELSRVDECPPSPWIIEVDKVLLDFFLHHLPKSEGSQEI